jgi:GDP-L-fucose synthase
MFDWAGKRVGITGASGMVGRHLIDLLVNAGAVPIALDLVDPSLDLEFHRVDLTDFATLKRVVPKVDVMMCSAGIKGSPDVCLSKPANFFVPMSQLNLNTMEACRIAGIRNVVYMSSVGVYGPAKVFSEDDVWKTMPSQNDWFGGWAKRLGEIQIEAYRKQGVSTKFHIIRPSNVYGKFDNFLPPGAMVVPSLISKAESSTDGYLHVLGDGTPRRDFVYAGDVARAAMFVVERDIEEPVNIGSGEGVSIGELANKIRLIINPSLKIKFGSYGAGGDNIRIMDMNRLLSKGFQLNWSLESGLGETWEWFKQNKSVVNQRFNPFG